MRSHFCRAYTFVAMAKVPTRPRVTDSVPPVCGVMEGQGAYNKHATLQAAGAASAFGVLRDAARALNIGRDGPIVIADYGSSEGKNSIAPLRSAVASLRSRCEPQRPIFVVHVDLPGNDFNTLFDVAGSAPDSYLAGDPFVFSSAIGRSFYTPVFPPDWVHLGWSSYAAVWLSQVPAIIPDHFIAFRSRNKAVRAAYARQAATDWELFLSLRAAELRHGGRLVVVLPAFDDAGSSGLDDFMDHANAALCDLVDAGAIGTDEVREMALAVSPRSKCDLLAPFAADGSFRGLTVEHCDIKVLPDAAWLAYERSRNLRALTREHTLFFRTTFIPTLASTLRDGRSADDRSTFANLLTAALERRLIDAPAPLDRFVATIVLAKVADSGVVRP